MRPRVAPSYAAPVSTLTSLARAESKHGWLMVFLVIGLWLAGGAAAVRGQSAVDGFDPHANNILRVIVVQPDGKILIGGEFTTLSPNGGVAVTRNHIARLNSDGTLDTAFNPNAANTVWAIALQTDGKVIVGGAFSGANSIGGQPRNFIARLDATTGLADSFNPNANNQIRAVAVQSDGKILAGGDFISIGGGFTTVLAVLTARNDMARFNTDDSLDTGFDPNADPGHVVRAIAVQTDGKILAVGDFTQMSGQPRHNIARLDGNTGFPDSFDPNSNDTLVHSVALQTDGKILVGGGFNGANSIGGQTRNYIARLDPTTGLADSFDPNAGSDVRTIAVQSDGKILVGGDFGSFVPNGGASVNRNFIARLTDAPTAANGNVSGHIIDNNGNPVEGAMVRLSGTQNRRFMTDKHGDYSFDNVETGGFYTVTPSRVNYLFSPASRSFSQLANNTDAVFSATATSGTALNPLDTPEYFVRQQYLDFLGREPDESGFNFWSDQILSCNGEAACVEGKRINVSAAFFFSIEFQQTGYLIYRVYQAAYGNMPGAPVPVKLSEFKPDTAAIGNGVVVNKSGWGVKLEDNTQAFASEFVQRARFTGLYAGMSAGQFVDTLNHNADFVLSQPERDQLVNDLSRNAKTRAQVLRSVAENSVLAQQKFNQAFVLMQYFGYLGRDPNTGPDTDFSGYNFWLGKLNSFNGNFQNAEMVKAFLLSSEYRGRFPR